MASPSHIPESDTGVPVTEAPTGERSHTKSVFEYDSFLTKHFSRTDLYPTPEDVPTFDPYMCDILMYLSAEPLPEERYDPIIVPGSDPVSGFNAFEAAVNEGFEGRSSQTLAFDNNLVPRRKRSKRGTRNRRRPSMDDRETRPNWLPEGWKMISKTRTSGATAGVIDKYYVELATRRRFRSKVEVKRFLKKRNKKKTDLNADAMPSDTGIEMKNAGGKPILRSRKRA